MKFEFLLNKYIMLIIIIFSYESVSAYFLSSSLWNKDNKKILIIGDSHIKGQTNERDKQLLAQFFQKLEMGNQKICFILEGNAANSGSKSINVPLSLAYAGVYAKTRFTENKLLKFVIGDIREGAIKQLLHVYREIKKIKIRFEETSFKPAAICSTLHEKINEVVQKRQRGYFTGQDVLNELQSGLKKISDPSLIDNVYYKDFEAPLKQLTEKINSVYNNILKFIQEYNCNINDSVFNLLTNAIVVSDSFEPLNKFASYFEIILRDLADAGFLYYLINLLDKCDKVMLYFGNNHAIRINDFIKNAGYISVIPPIGKYQKDTGGLPLEKESLEHFFSKFIEPIEKSASL